jgi:Family of unknown function (DUF6600)/FecR protein
MRGRLLLTFTLSALVCPPALYAQSTQPEPEGVAPAHVSYVDGAVTLEREGRSESSPLNMPLLSGDRLRTLEGRVEVLFADGSTLHLDARSTIDVQSDELVRLQEGRLRLNILGPQSAVAYRIDSAAGSARITQPGEYRIAYLRPSTELRAGGTEATQLEVAVIRGAAEVFTDQGSTPVRAGERAYASAGLMPSYAYAYNSASQDAFDRWSEDRRDVRLGVSSQYLPEDMQAYAPVLDQSGDWRQTESYGYAWYPRVAPDWRPYFYGRWDSYPRYGWTWIGADRFAWPTHHYGRWGFSAGAWFWVPSSRWAPAYVSWAYAPGYVSWCPLGFNNQPIFGINVYRPGYSPWRGWTAVSYSHFGGRGSYVHQRAVNWDRYAGQRPRFETRPSAPGLGRDVAVPRNSTPIRWAGSRSLPPEGGSYGSPRGDGSAPRVNSPRDSSPRDSSWLPPSGGRSTAIDRQTGAASPRYINRGDEIVRSRTERPSPRAGIPVTRPAAEDSAIPRQTGADRPIMPAERIGVASRTIPDGAARPSRSESTPFDPSTGPGSPGAQSRGDAPQARPFDRAQGRSIDPSRPSASPRAEPRADGVPARPRASGGAPEPNQYQPQPRAAEPRAAAPHREEGPRAYERPAPSETQGRPVYGGQSRPAPERDSPRAAPAERAPSRAEGRQPSAERASPSPPSGPAPSAGGGAVPRRGRGGL